MLAENNNLIKIRPDLLQALINHAEHGITIAEKEGDNSILLYVNKAFIEMTGYAESEILDRDCRFLQNEDRNQHGITTIHHAINEETPVRAVLRNYRKNGQMFWNDVTITPYFDEQDSIMYFLGVQKDITESVVTEHELKKYDTYSH